MSAVVRAYVTLIKNGVKSFGDVDAKYKEQVRQALKAAGLEDLATEE